jgi:hypothetical protein
MLDAIGGDLAAQQWVRGEQPKTGLVRRVARGGLLDQPFKRQEAFRLAG